MRFNYFISTTALLGILFFSFSFYFQPAYSAEDAADSAFTFVALDVGEGQALLLKKGSHGILVDTGNLQHAAHVLARLEALGITFLDSIILTHLHPDHASGVFRIAEAFPNAALLHSCHPFNATRQSDVIRWTQDFLRDAAHAKHSQTRCASAGEQLIWQGINLNFLWPKDFANDDLNFHSLVIEVIVDKELIDAENAAPIKLLLTGDANQLTEQQLLKNPDFPQAIDIFVAGHHGAKDTLSDGFLNWIQPSYSIISTNKNNARGYPDPGVLKRLGQRSQKELLTTYQHGEICFSVQQAQLKPCS